MKDIDVIVSNRSFVFFRRTQDPRVHQTEPHAEGSRHGGQRLCAHREVCMCTHTNTHTQTLKKLRHLTDIWLLR